MQASTRIVPLRGRQRTRFPSEAHGSCQLSPKDGLGLLHRLHAPRGSEFNAEWMLRELLERGADIHATSRDERTAMHLAVQNGHANVVEALLKLGARNTADQDRWSPQLYADKLGKEVVIACFGRHPRNDEALAAFAKDMECAISHNDLYECKELHRLGCPMDVALPGCQGCSPLIYALYLDKFHIAEWLLEVKATTLKIACKEHGGWDVALSGLS
jgi:hypothetical protein